MGLPQRAISDLVRSRNQYKVCTCASKATDRWLRRDEEGVGMGLGLLGLVVFEMRRRRVAGTQ